MNSRRFWKGFFSGPVWIVLFLMASACMYSCQNEEGFGGTASISGKLNEVFFNEDFSQEIHEQPAVDEEVFILFGDKAGTGDRVTTDIDGNFIFKYLYPGSYHIYYRSDDSSQVLDDGWSEMITVELASGEDLDLGSLEMLNTLDYDEGGAQITGTVKRIKYDKDSFWPNLVIEYTDFAHEYEVYLRYGEGPGYDERVRTAHDGTFLFKDLIPGTYTVFLFSEDVSDVVQHVVLEFEVKIEEFDEQVDLGEITVEAK